MGIIKDKILIEEVFIMELVINSRGAYLKKIDERFQVIVDDKK